MTLVIDYLDWEISLWKIKLKMTHQKEILFSYSRSYSCNSIRSCGMALIDQMNPSADVLALASIEVDLEPLEPGQSISVLWRGKPLLLEGTEEEIKSAQDVDFTLLKDPESDSKGL